MSTEGPSSITHAKNAHMSLAEDEMDLAEVSDDDMDLAEDSSDDELAENNWDDELAQELQNTDGTQLAESKFYSAMVAWGA